jgi:Tfp pilus assembly protein PilO
MNRNITATILIILAVAIYFTFTKDLWTQAMSVKADNDQYVTALDSAQKLVEKRDQVLKAYNNISSDDRDKLDKMVPNTVDNIRLIIDLNNVALKNGLSLKNISAGAKSDASGAASSQTAQQAVPSRAFGASADSISIPTPDTVNVSFDVSATYLQFISFMQALEANLRIMDVSHLSVTANDSGTYDFSVQLNTYWLRQ